jgi:hypothetical protein
MVNKYHFLLILVAAIFFFNCDFNYSLFPDYIAEITHTSSLQSNFEDADYIHFKLDVMMNDEEEEYIFILARSQGEKHKRLLILDHKLNIIQDYESEHLGSLYMIDANENFVIGQEVWNARENKFYHMPSIGDPYGHGFSANSMNILMHIDNEPNPDVLISKIYNSDWQRDAAHDIVYVFNLNDEDADYQIEFARTTRNIAHRDEKRACLILQRKSDNYTWALHFPEWAADNPEPFSETFSIGYVYADTVSICSDGIIVWNDDDRIRLYHWYGNDEGDGDENGSHMGSDIEIKQFHNVLTAYSMHDGMYFFDPSEKQISHTDYWWHWHEDGDGK